MHGTGSQLSVPPDIGPKTRCSDGRVGHKWDLSPFDSGLLLPEKVEKRATSHQAPQGTVASCGCQNWMVLCRRRYQLGWEWRHELQEPRTSRVRPGWSDTRKDCRPTCSVACVGAKVRWGWCLSQWVRVRLMRRHRSRAVSSFEGGT